ncbi:hypothetical protein D3C77_361320 [compost metagenome]
MFGTELADQVIANLGHRALPKGEGVRDGARTTAATLPTAISNSAVSLHGTQLGHVVRIAALVHMVGQIRHAGDDGEVVLMLREQ